MKPDLTVVIPTFNREKILKKCLYALQRQIIDHGSFEVIIINDGSTDNTDKMVRDFQKQSQLDIRSFYQKNKLSGAARNLGIENSRSELVLLIDDDIVARRNLLQSHLDLHRVYPTKETAILGRIITGETGVELCRRDDKKMKGIGTTENGDMILHPATFTTQNVSFKKEFLIRSGLFHTRLPRLIDIEFAFRIKSTAFRLIYAPNAVGFHLQPTNTMEKVIDRGMNYGQTLAQWYDEIPHFRKEIGNFGARLDGGLQHFSANPGTYTKDAISRWIINRFTVQILQKFANKIPITNPPNHVLVRLCREIWAYHYRNEFNTTRKEVSNNKSTSVNRNRVRV